MSNLMLLCKMIESEEENNFWLKVFHFKKMMIDQDFMNIELEKCKKILHDITKLECKLSMVLLLLLSKQESLRVIKSLKESLRVIKILRV